MVFSGLRQTERYSDEMTARRDARLIASNPRYADVRVEQEEE